MDRLQIPSIYLMGHAPSIFEFHAELGTRRPLLETEFGGQGIGQVPEELLKVTVWVRALSRSSLKRR